MEKNIAELDFDALNSTGGKANKVFPVHNL